MLLTALADGGDQAGVLEDAQVLHDAEPGHVAANRSLELAQRPAVMLEKLVEHRPASRIGQRLENRIGRHATAGTGSTIGDQKVTCQRSPNGSGGEGRVAAAAGANRRRRRRRGRAGVCGAGSLVPGGPVEESVDGERCLVDGRVEVTQLGEPSGNRVDREVVGLDVGNLVPRDRRGDGGRGQTADRVRGRHRVVPGVLVVVDEHRRWVTVLAPPGRGHVVGGAPLDLAGEGERGAADVSEAEVRLDPHVDVQPVTARGLRPAHRADLVEHLVDHAGDTADPGRRAIGHGVEIDAPLVGLLGVAPPRVPRDGTRRWTSAPPRSRAPTRLHTTRLHAAHSGGSGASPSRSTAARQRGPASGAPSRR